MIYQLVASTYRPYVKFFLRVIPPAGFEDWSETKRDQYMVICAADALAKRIGHRPKFLNFDYFELHGSISYGYPPLVK